jgi:heptose I phosphotransferase
MNHGSLIKRLTSGSGWTWISDDYRAAVPEDLDQTVMTLESTDRHHSKQGRSTARVRFDSAWGQLTVYLKRHYRLPWRSRLAALIHPSGRHTPASAEWAHLDQVQRLGIAVPDVVAAGERIGPWGALQSFLMVAELVGCLPLNEALPQLESELESVRFEGLKRALVLELAEIVARLHVARTFHKDLYLCHFFIDSALGAPPGKRLTLIDLHRLGSHRWTALRWRLKDLAQLLYSSYEVPCIRDRDRLRFWRMYRKAAALMFPKWQAAMVRRKAARYLAHNR